MIVRVYGSMNYPVGFQTYTRGSFKSEKRAIADATKRGPEAFVVYEPESRFHEEAWFVGHVVAK